MRTRKIIYTLLLLISIYASLMYEDEFPSFLLNFLIIIVVICRLQSFISGRLVTAEVEDGFSMAKRGRMEHLFVKIKKNGILPMVRTRLLLSVRDVSRNRVQNMQLEFWMKRKEDIHREFVVQFAQFGYYEIELRRLYVNDFVGLTRSRARVRTGKKASILVLPEAVPMFITIERKIDRSVGELDEFSMTQSGNDPSQVYDIRNYKEGDRIQMVHWKLTYKMDDLLVKELSMPLGWPAKIFLDFKKKENLLDIRSLQTLISLYMALKLMEMRFQIVWQRKNGDFISSSSESAVEDLFFQLFSDEMALEGHALEKYEILYPDKRCEHLFYLTDYLDESNAFYLEKSHNANRKTIFCCEPVKERVSCPTIELAQKDWQERLRFTPIQF